MLKGDNLNIPAARMVFSDDDRAAVLSMVDQVLRTGSMTLGPFTKELEESFRVRHDAPHAVAVSSGTSALEIILRTLDVEGREVVVPANTFFATAASVMHAGGKPRFADVAPDTMALSAETVEAALGDETAGVVVVHIGGLISPEVEAIRQLCDQRDCSSSRTPRTRTDPVSMDGQRARSASPAPSPSIRPRS